MDSETYFIARDIDGLRRHAELVELENTFLKGRVRALNQSLREARAATKAAEERLEALRDAAPAD